ncbi:unnamed protein product [Victoria cruziana]
MGISQKCRFAFLFICLITAWACDKTSLSITQQRTALTVAGKPEWQVVVANTCNCPQSSILVTCAGFSTTEDVDPSILRKTDTDPNYCILGDGKPIPLNSNISFTYAWDDPFLFLVYSSTLSCK